MFGITISEILILAGIAVLPCLCALSLAGVFVLVFVIVQKNHR